MRHFLANLSTFLVAVLVATPLLLACHGYMADTGVRTAMQGPVSNDLSLPFVENRGQMDPRVAFYANSFAGTVFVTRDGNLVQALPAIRAGWGGKRTAWALVEHPVGRAAAPVAGQVAITQVSMTGPGRAPSNLAHLPTYASVRLPTPWQGVELAVRVRGDSIERLFTLSPGADPHEILMDVKGASSLSVREGSLVAMTGLGPVRYTRPSAYQFVQGRRREVPVQYRIDGMRYGFILGTHDISAPVVIDPLIQATYVGGGDGDGISGMYVDGNNAIYVTGFTLVDTFPGTSGGAISSTTAGTNIFVAKLSHDLKTLEQATYLVKLTPNSGLQYFQEALPAVMVKRNPVNGNIYVVGPTTGGLPGAAGGASSTFSASTSVSSTDAFDGFAAELNPGLTNLIQATYIGGTGNTAVSDMGFSSGGDLYVAGWTTSSDLPAVTGGAQTTLDSSAGSAFVSELAADLKSFAQSSFYGAGVKTGTVHFGTDSVGDVYLAGTTTSSSLTNTSGGAQSSLNGTDNAFVCKLSGNLTAIAQATYLGGSGEDDLSAVTLDSHGDVYLSGNTNSTDFPATAGGAIETNPSGSASNPTLTDSAFISKLNSALTAIMQSTYLGSYLGAPGNTLGVDSSGDVFVAGAEDSGIPVLTGGFQPISEAFVTQGFISKLDSGLTSVEQSSSLSYEWNNPMAVNIPAAIGFDANGNVYLGGTGLVMGTTGGAQASIPGADVGASGAGYVMAMSPDLKAGAVKLVMTPQQSALSGVYFTFPFMLSNESTTQEATNLVLTFQIPPGVSLQSVANAGTVMRCETTGQTATCSLAVLTAGQSTLITANFLGSDSLSGELTGKVLLSAGQSLAAGSTRALVITVMIGGGSSGGSNSSGGSSGGGDTGLLETILMAGVICGRFLRRRRFLVKRP